MMPIYEYKCDSCGCREEKLQKYGAPAPVCKTCAEEMKKCVSVTTFSLSGDGWAKDNYGLKQAE
jgi:putative FmdB family regulatory protein